MELKNEGEGAVLYVTSHTTGLFVTFWIVEEGIQRSIVLIKNEETMATLMGLMVKYPKIRIAANLGGDIPKRIQKNIDEILEVSAEGSVEQLDKKENDEITEIPFGDLAKNAVVEAKIVADRYSDGIATEHLLLGILKIQDAKVSRLLKAMNIDEGALESSLKNQMSRGSCTGFKEEMTFYDSAKEAIKYAQGEAIDMGSDCIHTEHLLFGLMRQGEGLAGRKLKSFGADMAKMRRVIKKIEKEEGKKEEGNGTEK